MSQRDVTADWPTLMGQAPATAGAYMRAAVSEIDATFGEGYAAKNPGLVGSFMQTAAIDFHAASLSVAAQRLRDAIMDCCDTLVELGREDAAEPHAP